MSSPVTTLMMGAMEVGGTLAQGNAQYEAAKAERKQLGRMASEELAVSTRGMEAKAKEGQLLASRVQAVSATSGGMATDDSVLDIPYVPGEGRSGQCQVQPHSVPVGRRRYRNELRGESR